MTKSCSENIAVLIPAYAPGNNLIRLLEGLRQEGFCHIVLVNDGSPDGSLPLFDRAELKFGCHVINHPVNLGKGRALKSGFAYILEQLPDCRGVVTVDADGQHSAEDAARCAEKLIDCPSCLVLGRRSFFNKNVPLRSKIGNLATRVIFSAFSGLKIEDTQTGLRAIPAEFVQTLLGIDGERYEFEMNMLLAVKGAGLSVVEVPIQTIYIDGGKDSHFHPFWDSLKIYYIFLRFLISSLLSFLLDILIFSVMSMVLKPLMPGGYIFLSTAVARVCSSMFNYLTNASRVFKQKEKKRVSAVKYYLLCVVQMTVSAVCVQWLTGTVPYNETLLKILVDSVLFFISFLVQKSWVFKCLAWRLGKKS